MLNSTFIVGKICPKCEIILVNYSWVSTCAVMFIVSLSFSFANYRSLLFKLMFISNFIMFQFSQNAPVFHFRLMWPELMKVTILCCNMLRVTLCVSFIQNI